ncbi:MAG: hypothetical protein EOP54_02410 [Sphingobacteriales bacterium]|nr:MAG: hypothetical protein EOP54_02410 [Sphingobacteriales bacterium]
MKLRILAIYIIILSISIFRAGAQDSLNRPPYFEGSIQYSINFTDLQDNNINKKMAPFFDLEQTMYVDRNNYKMVNKDNQHVKLFQGKYNAYFFFNRDNTAYKIDQTSKSSQRTRVYDIDDVDTILGYPCKAVKVDGDYRAYIYFYNPDISIDIEPYQNYNMEEWNVYLKAVNGALPLRVITIDIRSKFIEDRMAIKVTRMDLQLSEFDFPSTVKLRKLKYGMDLIW